MCRIHDRDNSGAVSVEEFKTLHQFLLDTQNRFQQADTRRHGRIDKQTVERALQAQGVCREFAAPICHKGPRPMYSA